VTSIETPDPTAMLDAGARRRFAAICGHLIPAAHGMPSGPELGEDVRARLETLERDEPSTLAAFQLVIVGGYYTDRRVRELIGYPGQEAIEVRSWRLPEYIDLPGRLAAGLRRTTRDA
jgi:hypothetical protein